MEAPRGPDEEARLEAVRRYHILDTAPEGAYDDLTRLAAHICCTPIALISLVDVDRQWFKSRFGLPVIETHRKLSFCAYAIQQDEPLVVPDAVSDPRFSDNALVLGPPHIRSYAGAPLVTPDGFRLGTLCVIDRVPRTFSAEQLDLLRALSRQVVTQMELRLRAEELQTARSSLEKARDELEQRVAERTTELRNAASSLLAQAEEMRKTELTVREREAQLAKANQIEVIGRLAGGIAHDFNNLLTVILGYCDVACSELPADSPAVMDLKEITRAALRARELTSRLLATTRIRPSEPMVVDLGSSLSELRRLLSRVIRADIQLDIQSGEQLWPVLIDPRHLEQALVNLAVNARDAMPAGGQLRIRAGNVMLSADLKGRHTTVPAGEYVVIAVSDTGRGMSEEVLARLFEPFFTTKGAGEGTGLGLATSAWMLAQAGACMLAESQPGRGSTLRIYLPRHVDGAGRAITLDAGGQERGGGEHLLLVDDDPAVRAIAGRVLRQRGYSVIEASNGAEALETAQRAAHPIELAIVDLVMPTMGGPELVAHLHARWPAMQILFTSGYADLNSAPGTMFLPKPYAPQALLQKVREVLDAPL